MLYYKISINFTVKKKLTQIEENWHNVYIITVLHRATQTDPLWWQCSLLHYWFVWVEMGVSIAYPPQLRASGEAQGEPSWVPSCLSTNKLSDTAADGLMLHLYSISSMGEESVVLCPNHNNRVSLNDGSLRARGQVRTVGLLNLVNTRYLYRFGDWFVTFYSRIVLLSVLSKQNNDLLFSLLVI